MPNPTCAHCPKAYNHLNGRYCTIFKKLVEHSKEPICKTDKK